MSNLINRITSLDPKFILVLIVLVGAILRLPGLDWDQGHYLHPDERFLGMVTNDIQLPSSPSQYFDVERSPLNPANKDYTFFVYGTAPIFLLKLVTVLMNIDGLSEIIYLGRVLTTIADLTTIPLIYFLVVRLLPITQPQQRKNLALATAFFYAILVLPIQLSHFFAVDPFLNLFLLLTIIFTLWIIRNDPPLDNRRLPLFMGLGVSLGLALGSKLSAILVLPAVGLGLIIFLIHQIQFTPTKLRKLDFSRIKLLQSLLLILLLLITTYATFRFTNPYVFQSSNWFNLTPNPNFLQSLDTLQSFNNPDSSFPPAIQWITTQPIIFPLVNLIEYGLGVPITVLVLVGIIRSTKDLWRNRSTILLAHSAIVIILVAVLVTFFYHAIQFVKPLRYFLPIYPFLAILAAQGLLHLWQEIVYPHRYLVRGILFASIFSLLLTWPIAFTSIFYHDHPRIQASEWIYQNLPDGSTLTCEHWDDCLPLNLKGHQPAATHYQLQQLELYLPDSPTKWEQVLLQLQQSDYIILSSNRLYGSITTVPDRYPVTSRFYRELFAGETGFTPIAEFTNRPQIKLPGMKICLESPFLNYGKISKISTDCPSEGITFIDDFADETFTVYDHPKVTIFRKIGPVNFEPY